MQTNFVSVREILIPDNRQRKSFDSDAIEELKKSIVERGLMNPITLRADGRTLIAGERRLRAMTELHQSDQAFACNGLPVASDMIPFNCLADLSPLEIEEAELEENTIRLDLTWQEKAAAVQRLFQLRQNQMAERNQQQTSEEGASPVYTTTDLIEELTGTREGSKTIRESLVVAEHLGVPEVAAAKTHRDAVNVVKKLKQKAHRAKLAETAKEIKTPHVIILGDAIEELKKLPDTFYDVLLTDPPYGIGADSFGSFSTTEHKYDDTEEQAFKLYDVLAIESFRVCKSEAHGYVFCTIENFQIVSLCFSMAGWEVWKRPIIWNKLNGILPQPEFGPRYTYEAILFVSKGKRKTLCVKPDIISIGQNRGLDHAAQKPVELLRDLLSRSALPGDQILDPFAGSGSTLEAAELSQCRATLVEIEKDNYDMCLERLSKLEITL